MSLIDAHQHFWALSTPGHEWPTPDLDPIHRDFGPRDLVEAAAGAPLKATVLVQSQPTDADTEWMLAIAEATPLVAAVVGWTDLAAPDVQQRIGALALRPKLRGLRPMLQAISNTDWLLDEHLTPAFTAMLTHGLRLDALVQPRHLPMLARFVDRWPNLQVVIDHGAKPFAARGGLDPWRANMAALAGRGVYCKLSGLRTQQARGQSADDLRPYVEHLVKCFGEHLMWGSDWPVLLLSGDSYRQWLDDAARLSGDKESEQLFFGAAREFYELRV